MGWSSGGGGGLTAAEREKLAKIDVGLKSNLNATSAPTVNDDITEGYGVGSTWKYNNITYVCGDATDGKAEWAASTDIYYFNTWAELIAAISVAGTTYVNKYANVANANGGPVGGATYTAPAALTNYIVDGGAAAYKITAQGTNFSVTCAPRTITNPVVTSVMVTSALKPTLPGYYIFTVIPTNGLPTGIALNDIAYYDGTNWSLYQLYIKASTVLVATNQTGTTQVTWRKFAGTWMSTADEYIPDAKEYQTSKLWNGKPVFRKCISGTTNGSVGQQMSGTKIPVTGTLLLTSGSLTRGTGTIICNYPTMLYFVNAYGDMMYETTDSGNCGRPYVMWVEYTKS